MYGLEFTEKISRNQQFARLVRQKKQEMINDAISWSGKTERGTFVFHDLWESDDKRYKVSLGKYGKEYYLDTIKWKDGHQGNNIQRREMGAVARPARIYRQRRRTW